MHRNLKKSRATLYPHALTVVLSSYLLLLTPLITYSQLTGMAEICDNGLDDDGDGLYDDYDPDCICQAATEPLSYISNGDFEEIDVCCQSMDSDDLVCLEDWFLVTLSPDYLSPSCPPSDLDLLQSVGIPFSGGFIGMGASTVDGFLRTEALGTCLEAPLKSCREYRINFQSLALSTLDFSPIHDTVQYVIYGLPDCPLATDLDVSQSFCDNPLFDRAEEIISFNVIEDNRDEWIRHVNTFIPRNDINAIVIYVRCGQEIQVQTGNIPFVYFDDFEFSIGPVDCVISGQVELTGDPCLDDYTFSATNVTNAEAYQWYKDSIPIIGATEATYRPPSGAVSGYYSAYISNNVECAFVDGGRLIANQTMTTQILDTICTDEFVLFGMDTIRESGDYTRTINGGTTGCDELETLSLFVIPDMPTQILDTICTDEFVVFGLDTIREAGDYTRTINSSAVSCDQTETLSLYVIPDVAADIDFDPGLNVTIGSDLVLTPSDVFLDQITGYIWLENGIEVNRGSPVLTSTVASAGDVSYSFVYTHGQGCTQTISFTVEWAQPVVVPEDCTNNIDDDLDGLVDTFDDDCDCTLSQSQLIEIDAQICQGESYDFGGAALEESGTYRDTFVNAINCDSIIALTLDIISDQRDTTYQVIDEDEQYLFFGESFDEAGWYTFIETDNASPCDSIYVLRLDIDYALELYVPNIISLSSAAGNDQLYISPNKPITISNLSIFNRWGNLVFEREQLILVGDDPAIWDGTLNGEHVDIGVYLFTFEYTEGEETQQVIGDLTVIP